MKAWKLVLTVVFALASVATAAKTLEITVTDIRSDKGNVLAMAKVAGREQPIYGMSPDERQTLGGVQLSVFHVCRISGLKLRIYSGCSSLFTGCLRVFCGVSAVRGAAVYSAAG